MVEKYENVNKSIKRIAVNNFVGGIMWGLGATIGLSLLLAIIGFAASKVDWIPVVGDFVTNVTGYVAHSNSQMLK